MHIDYYDKNYRASNLNAYYYLPQVFQSFVLPLEPK
jgi:hypothetical protein